MPMHLEEILRGIVRLAGEIFQKIRLQILLHILETSQDAEEKKATLQQISRLAEAMKDIIR